MPSSHSGPWDPNANDCAAGEGWDGHSGYGDGEENTDGRGGNIGGACCADDFATGEGWDGHSGYGDGEENTDGRGGNIGGACYADDCGGGPDGCPGHGCCGGGHVCGA